MLDLRRKCRRKTELRKRMSIYNDAIYLEDIPEKAWPSYIGKGYRSVCYTTDANRNG